MLLNDYSIIVDEYTNNLKMLLKRYVSIFFQYNFLKIRDFHFKIYLIGSNTNIRKYHERPKLFYGGFSSV